MKRFIFFFALISALSFLTGCGSKNEPEIIRIDMMGKKLEIPMTYAPENQNAKERIIKELKLKPAFQIGGLEDTTLLFPTCVRTDADGNIYILDATARQVKKFDSKGV